jgi:POT family proton-dependent oligopeptide transporter
LSVGEQRPFRRDEWRAMGAIVLLALPVTFFWATYEQSGNTIILWADGYTDRTANLLFWTAQIPATWFHAVNPFMIFAFTPFLLALWRQQAARGTEPATIVKLAYGCFLVAAAYLIMAAAATQAGTGVASWLWLLVFFVALTIGELYLSPTSLSLVTKVAPARTVSMMMGVWLATSFTGNLAAGYLGSFWSAMEKRDFFFMIAGIAAAAGLAVLAFVRPLRAILRD